MVFIVRDPPPLREKLIKEDREHGPHPHIAKYLQVETQASVGGTHADANNTAPGMATATAALGALCGRRGAAGLAGSLAMHKISIFHTQGFSASKRSLSKPWDPARSLIFSI